MINRDELAPIGKFLKPHGIKGEITFSFTNESFVENECPFLICEIDGIFVPFRIEKYRFISNSTAYIQLKNIDNDAKARILSNKVVLFPIIHVRKSSENESFTWNDFIGFILIDKQLGKIGRIADIDHSTINTLFVVEKEDDEILIPAVEEFIIRMDENLGELWVDLPEGLVESNG